MPEPILTAAPPSPGIAHPLDEFYRRAGLPIPQIQTLPPSGLPEPYRQLLDHSKDMTSTLENFHQGRIYVEVLGREQRGNAYFREVTLVVEGTNKIVEFGAIQINLGLFEAPARELILAERWPLGRILNDLKIPYASRPKAFLKVNPDELMCRLLKLNGAAALFGRRNQLFDPAGKVLAEIVEILPP